jgi:hypothetical protein
MTDWMPPADLGSRVVAELLAKAIAVVEQALTVAPNDGLKQLLEHLDGMAGRDRQTENTVIGLLRRSGKEGTR